MVGMLVPLRLLSSAIRTIRIVRLSTVRWSAAAKYAHDVTGDIRVGAIDELLQRAADGGRISADEALLLYTDAPLHALGEAADAVRRRRYPEGIVTYLIDRNIN